MIFENGILTAVALFTAPAFLIADAGMSGFQPIAFRTRNQSLAVFFIPALMDWLWILVASIVMLRAPAGPPGPGAHHRRGAGYPGLIPAHPG